MTVSCFLQVESLGSGGRRTASRAAVPISVPFWAERSLVRVPRQPLFSTPRAGRSGRRSWRHREFGPWVPGTSGRDWNGTGGARLKVLAKEVSTMARTDIYLDTMLRHLGAAYYESLHGRAARSDVTRALDTVEEHLNEPASSAAPRSPARPPAVHPAGHPAEHPVHPGPHTYAD